MTQRQLMDVYVSCIETELLESWAVALEEKYEEGAYEWGLEALSFEQFWEAIVRLAIAAAAKEAGSGPPTGSSDSGLVAQLQSFLFEMYSAARRRKAADAVEPELLLLRRFASEFELLFRRPGRR